MANPLSGKIRIEINGAPATTAESVQLQYQRTTKKRKGAYGAIGIAQSETPDITINVTFAVPEQRSEFIEISSGNLFVQGPTRRFAMKWYEGSEAYLATGCVITSNSMSSDQDGDATRQVSIMPEDVVEV